MTPELSRRVAKLMHTDTMFELRLKEGHTKFADTLEKAETFDNLPDNYKKAIVKAEGER